MKKIILISLFWLGFSFNQSLLADNYNNYISVLEKIWQNKYQKKLPQKELSSIYSTVSIGMNRQENLKSTVNTYEIVTENDSFLSLAIGKKFNFFRVEIERATTKNKISNQTQGDFATNLINSYFKTKTTYLNAYLDFALMPNLKSYIGLGLGETKLEVDGKNNIFNDTVISYQLKLGTSYEINQNTDWFVGYRYIKYDDFVMNSEGSVFTKTLTVGPKTHIIETGIKFNF